MLREIRLATEKQLPLGLRANGNAERNHKKKSEGVNSAAYLVIFCHFARRQKSSVVCVETSIFLFVFAECSCFDYI